MSATNNSNSAIPEFYPSMDNAHFTIIAGNSRCGKTVLMQDLVTKASETHPEFRFWNKITLCCPTYNDQVGYQEFIPPEWALEDFDLDAVIADLIQTQKAVPVPQRQRVLLIIDDVIGVSTSQKLQRLATSGRWFKIDTIILVQSMKVITGPTIRSNASYILCGKIADTSREQIVKNVPLGSSTIQSTYQARRLVDSIFRDKYRFIGFSNNPSDPEVFTYKVDYNTFDPIQFATRD